MKVSSKNLLWGVGTFLAIIVGLWAVWQLTTVPADTSSAKGKKMDLSINPTDHILGPDTASVTIVEYSDLQCPACQAYYPVVKQILAKNPETVRLVYRHFPLEQHQHAREAAYAAEAAALQDKFFDYHDLLFDNQDDWESAKDATSIFIGYAKELKLDTAKFKADMASKEVKAKVDADQKSGLVAQVDSTPSFFINGVKIQNPNSFDDFQGLIQAAIKSAGAKPSVKPTDAITQ